MVYIPKMLKAFIDPAVPDGAGTMGTESMMSGSASGGASATGASGAGSDGTTSKGKYYAACTDCPGSGWIGPNRDTSDDAKSDADGHNKKFSGHTAAVVYP